MYPLTLIWICRGSGVRQTSLGLFEGVVVDVVGWEVTGLVIIDINDSALRCMVALISVIPIERPMVTLVNVAALMGRAPVTRSARHTSRKWFKNAVVGLVTTT